MAKFRVIIEGTYEVDQESLERCYGTTDLEECAKIDAQNSPYDMLAWMDLQGMKATVVVVEGE
jgi:hypothetical protein